MSACNIKGAALAVALALIPTTAFGAYNPYVSPGTPVVVLAGVDNGPAINAAIALVAAGQAPAPVIVPSLPGGADPTFSTPISNPSVVQVVTAGCPIFNGSGADAWVQGKNGSSNIPMSMAPSNICVQRSAVNWADHFAGISLRNVYQSQETLSATGFYIGIDDNVDTASYYNIFNLGALVNDQIGIRLFATGSVGAPNQNTFVGGRWSTFSNVGSTTDVIGVLFEINNTSVINSNVFINPDFELSKAAVGSLGNVVIFSGKNDSGASGVAENNRVFGMREESSVTVGGGSVYMLGGTGLLNNTIEIGYGFPPLGAATNVATTWLAPVDTTGSELQLIANGITGTGDAGQGNPGLVSYIAADRNSVVLRSNSGTQTLGRAGDGIFWVLGSTTCSVGLCSFSTEQPHWALSTGTLQSTAGFNAYGRIFDLRANNNDFLRLLTVTTNSSIAGGRIIVVPFSPSGTMLTSASTPLPCCGVISNTGFSFSTALQAWTKSNDLPAGQYSMPVALDPTVGFVFIGITGGSAVSNLRSMTVQTISGSQIVPLSDNSVWPAGTLPCLDVCTVMPDHRPYSVAIPAPPLSGNGYPQGLVATNIAPQSSASVASNWIYQANEAQAAASMTCATPSVVSLTQTFKAGQPVVLGGSPCTGFVAGTTYYVISAGLTGSAFELSATPGGAAINGTGSSSGLTVSTAWAPGPSVP